jgi:O-antigen/teichoic acid export membrane protein
MWWSIIDQSVVSGCSFATMAILARQLGLQGFGVFSVVWMSVQFFAALKMAFITAPMNSLAPKYDSSSAFLGALLAAQVYGGLAIAAIGALVGVLYAATNETETSYAAFAGAVFVVVFFNQLQDFARRLFYLTASEKKAVVNDVISSGGQVVALLYVDRLISPSVASALYVIAATSALAIAVVMRPLFRLWRLRADGRGIWPDSFHFGKWIASAAVLQWTSGNLVLLVAGWRLGAGTLGGLRACQAILGCVNVLLSALENVVPFRAAAIARTRNASSVSRYVMRVALLVELLVGAVVVLVLPFAEAILRVVFGQDYVQYANVLRIWSVVYVLVALEPPLRAGLRALGDTRAIFWTYVIMTMLTLLSALPLINAYGVSGVMIGTYAVNAAMVLGLLYFFVHRVRSPAH